MDTRSREGDQSSLDRPIEPASLTCISHHPTVEARDTTARNSLRLLAVLNVLFKYACARLFPPPGSRLVLTALSRTSPRHVVRNAG